jgi:hypothetical protein
MSTNMYQEFEPDIKFAGDYVLVAGTLEVDGIADFDARVDANAGIAVTGTVTATKASLTTLAIAAPTGTTVGAAWTSGAPLLTDAQMCITITCGATAYKIPVWTV